MRTTKRFTPNLLDRYRDLGRGTGTYNSYIPWHRVSRSDPSSMGRSHLINWNGRHIELLSDGELISFCFASRLLGCKTDQREQFPLSLDEGTHELSAYDVRFSNNRYPGTLEIAEKLKIKHPMVHGDGRSAPWVMTTDLLLMLTASNGHRSLLAIATKDKSSLRKRAKELLKIEQSYWNCRGIEWLLITPHQYHPQVAETLHRTWQWSLQNRVPKSHLKAATAAIRRYQGRSLTFLLEKVHQEIGGYTQAQHAIWQAIWSGHAPVDLRRGWRPHTPLQSLSQADFDQLNPVLMRRSAWI